MKKLLYIMQFEYDPERLIEEVKKRRGLWDIKCVEHRMKRVRLKLWQEIVNELNPDTVNASKGERRELEYQLQKKWKGMRDSFFKYMNHPNRSKRPYIYTRHLQFLLKSSPNLQKKSDENTSESEDDGKKLSWKKKGVLALKSDSVDSSEEEADNRDNEDGMDANDNDNEDSRESRVKADLNATRSRDSVSNARDGVSFAFANVDAESTKGATDDPDRLFLLSLLPHLKTIPEEYKLNVKMDLMQVLHSATYNSMREHKIL